MVTMKDSKFEQYKKIESIEENISAMGFHKKRLEKELEELEKKIAKVSEELRQAKLELIYYLKTQVEGAMIA